MTEIQKEVSRCWIAYAALNVPATATPSEREALELAFIAGVISGVQLAAEKLADRPSKFLLSERMN